MYAVFVESASIFFTVLTMSLAGSVLVLIFFLIKPMVKSWLPKKMQYSLWLVVLMAFIIPISKIVVLPLTPVFYSQAVSPTPLLDAIPLDRFLVNEESGIPLDLLQSISVPEKTTGKNTHIQLPRVPTMLSAVWLMGAFVSFGVNVTSYLMFARRIKKRATGAHERELRVLASLSRKTRALGLYRNTIVPAPMLLGVFRPSIMLPDCEFTESQIKNILLHELVHLRRRDIAMKWLTAMTVALHWFNPFVYLLRREMNASCELACDEAVVSKLDPVGIKEYGDTLIAVVASHYSTKTSFFTKTNKVHNMFASEKRALKERLGSIMKFRKHSNKSIVLSCILLVFVVCMSVVLGSACSMGGNYFDIPPDDPLEDVITVEYEEDNKGMMSHVAIDSAGTQNATPSPHSDDGVKGVVGALNNPAAPNIQLHVGESFFFWGSNVSLLSVDETFGMGGTGASIRFMPSTVLFASSDESVFDVDQSGNITAVGYGDAICYVTVDYAMNENENETYTATLGFQVGVCNLYDHSQCR